MTGNLADPFKLRLSSSIDVLIFNPPYVPTSVEEVEMAQSAAGIHGSWAGGNSGMQVTDIFLKDVEV